MRVAVVGMDKMGIVHSCMLSVVPGVAVVALCEKNLMIRRFLKKVFTGAKIVNDPWKLADLGLGVVYVTTPIPSHFSIFQTVYSDKVAWMRARCIATHIGSNLNPSSTFNN